MIQDNKLRRDSRRRLVVGLVGHKTVESGTAYGLVWLGVLPHLSPLD